MGSKTHELGVYNIVFKFWPTGIYPGFRPWLGGAVGRGRPGSGIMLVLVGGVSWAREKQG